MAMAKNGDKVTVNYTLTTAGGQVLDTSLGRKPLQFTLGSREVIPGFDQAVLGMQAGQSKQVIVPPESAYGQHRAERVLRVKRSESLLGIRPHPGLGSALPDDDGQAGLFTVTESSKSWMAQDFNHPLAGKALGLDIQLLVIAPAVG